MYNLCAYPFMIIFEDIFKSKGIEIKLNKYSWANMLKVVISTDFYKLLSDYPVEVLEPKKVRQLEQFFDNNLTNQAEITKTSRALGRLITWARGKVKGENS